MLVKDPVPYDRHAIEERLDLVLPEALTDMWNEASSVERPTSSDCGRVVVNVALDRREEWPVVGDSLEDFLTKYLHAHGEKFWEPKLTHPV